MVVELEHFSEYAIVKDKKVENTVENKVENKVDNVVTNNTTQSEAKDETPKTGAKSIMIFATIISLIGLIVIKKEKYKK